MINTLTIVMYHYVRDVHKTPYPGIKALGIKEFTGQLEYIRRHYHVIDPLDLVACADDPDAFLPSNSLLLSFDDGYIDHFETVLPRLKKFGFKAVFSPVPRSCLEWVVLDVNKIHFILSATSDNVRRVVTDLFNLLDRYREQYHLESKEELYSRLAVASRFDPPEVIFIKRLLQRELAEPLRNLITDALFKKYVTADEAGFASELYMDPDQIKAMVGEGMTIASHGYDHYWLGTLSTEQQEEQIGKSVDFLKRFHPRDKKYLMCYPYGSYNESLLKILRRKKFVAGFTTAVDIVRPGYEPLLLPRLDTNDLPKVGTASPCKWTDEIS